MAMTTCAECSSEVSDQAEACPHCGAPVKVDAEREYHRLLAIDILARRQHRTQGIALTIVAFLLAVWGLENLFEGLPGGATGLIFGLSILAAYMVRLTFFMLMARRIRLRTTAEELRQSWLVLGGFD